jgi:membrane-associated phospholipid phosphatase
MSATIVDQAIQFVPFFVVPYLSFFLLVLVPLFTIDERSELRSVACGFGFIVLLSSAIFVCWPTRIPMIEAHPVLRMILAVDSDRNACPSMHASLGLYCALCGGRRLEKGIVRVGLAVWTMLVLLSTLFIKRHVMLDMAMGAALGCSTYAALHFERHWSGSRRERMLKVRNPNRPDSQFLLSNE